MEQTVVVEMRDISKRFPGVLALDHVNLRVGKGEVHALLGENGAGKSTLMKILSGVYPDYEGTVLFEGEAAEFRSERDALEKGIAIVPQELNPIPELTIAENIWLGREPLNRLGLVDAGKRLRDTREFMEKLGLDYDAGTKMKHLSVAQKQMVEIIKALSRRAKLLILDEPTSALTSSETEYLFGQIEKLKRQGIAVIFISHKLDEVYRICDCATVLRDGQWIADRRLSEVGEDELISMMVGREVKDIYPDLPEPGTRTALETEGLTGKGFSDISFQLREGEILGFAGMMGSGRTEIARSLFGMEPASAGRIRIEDGEVRIGSTQEAIRQGIVMVSEDRALYGFVGLRSIQENIALPNSDRFTRHQRLLRDKIRRESMEICGKLKVKAPGVETAVGNLSGGNQQKVVLAKWLIRDVKVLILDEPTRGIDVGAKQEIYRLITELAASGLAILLISSELPEVLAMSHRVKVLAGGRFAGEFSHEEATQDKIMKAIVEGSRKHEEKD